MEKLSFQITKQDGKISLQELNPSGKLKSFFGKYLNQDEVIELGFFLISTPYFNNQPPPEEKKYNPASPPIEEKGGHIYFIKGPKTAEGHHYKIGLTTQDPEQRFKQIQNSVPFKVELTHYYWSKNYRQLEQDLFDHIPEYRINGEWFNLPDEIYSSLIKKCL